MINLITIGIVLLKIAGYGDPAHWSWYAIGGCYLTCQTMLFALEVIIARGIGGEDE